MPCKEEFDVNQIRYEEGFFICAGHDAHGSRINRLQVEYDYPKQHITPRLLKFLADSYEFECEGECLATPFLLHIRALRLTFVHPLDLWSSLFMLSRN